MRVYSPKNGKGCVRMSLESLKVQIIKKAWEEPAFKNFLLSDPKNAIKEAFQVDLPAEIELMVVEETPTLVYFILPPKPEDVAAGDSGTNIVW